MTASRLLVHDPGPFATIQDSGRIGHQRQGITVSGAMDRAAFACANLLAGNPPGTAAIEFTARGGRYQTEGAACRLAVAGFDFSLAIDGRSVAAGRSHRLEPGQELIIGGSPSAFRGYLAIEGGFDIAAVLGSRSTHVRAGFGGWQGRALRPGDAVDLCRPADPRPDRALDPSLACEIEQGAPFRILFGPQDDYFDAPTRALLVSAEFRLSPAADRMGVRLDGPALKSLRGHDIVSDGVASGAIQVPGDGRPIVLLADCQPTGGYPKIACVIGADLDRLGQLRPGDTIRFVETDRDGAVEALRNRAAWIDRWHENICAVALPRTTASLLAVNLIDGVTGPDF